MFFFIFQYARKQLLLHVPHQWPGHGPPARHGPNDVSIFEPYHGPYYGPNDVPSDAPPCGGRWQQHCYGVSRIISIT